MVWMVMEAPFTLEVAAFIEEMFFVEGNLVQSTRRKKRTAEGQKAFMN